MTAFRDCITSEAELREHYRTPGELLYRKIIPRIDAHARAFISLATFAGVGTVNGDGTADVSPRGGPPGFIAYLDENRLALADLSGNNLLDTMTNLVNDPSIGLMIVIPGMEELLRVNGRGYITRDPDVLAATAIQGKTPKAAIGIEVREAFLHCAKAMRRSALWRSDEWPDTSGLPSIAAMFRDQMELTGIPAELIEAELEQGYQTTIWEPGGDQ